MTDEGQEALRQHLVQNANGAEEKAEAGNLWSAYEEFYVGMTVARMALKTDPADLTADRVELASRLGWAQAELEGGYGTRVPDDLENVPTLAESVE